MSLTVEEAREYAVTATCDQCGTTVSWVQHKDPEWHPSDQGWEFFDFTARYEPPRLWFHAPECVHAWIDSHVLYPPVEAAA